MRRPLVAGNWKMNGSKTSAKRLVEEIKAGIGSLGNVEVSVCPPFVYLQAVAEMLDGSDVALGAQNLCQIPESGAYTGEISAAMLNDFGCRYVIVGHSERRHIYRESDDLVAEKVAVAVGASLTPILCVGELLEEREAGQTEDVVSRQLDAVLAMEGGVEMLRSAVIAYEPVWAIGTGKTATPEQAQEVHRFIRARIAGHDTALADSIRLLYGGSVKASNAGELFAQEDIDGGLIGGASLKSDEFLGICGAG